MCYLSITPNRQQANMTTKEHVPNHRVSLLAITSRNHLMADSRLLPPTYTFNLFAMCVRSNLMFSI